MHLMFGARFTVIVSLVVGLSACSSNGSSRRGTQPSATAPTAAAAEWSSYGHDLANSRANALEATVNPNTVAQLKLAWSTKGEFGVTGTPVVAGGVVYYDDWAGSVRAVSATTGTPIWETNLGLDFIASPALTGDAVFVAGGATLARLDRQTGKVQWKVVTNDNPVAAIDASPVVVGNLVIQGTASNEEPIPKKTYTFRGSISAYDAKTGEERWRLYTTQNNSRDGPGVGIWSTPAVDVKRNLLYVGTGNAYAEPTGPLADSILAINYTNGKIEWSRQFRKSDVFSAGNPQSPDTDVGASPNMWTINGRDLVGDGDKAGVYHALDRDTGRVVWETHLSPGSVFGGALGSGAYVDGKLIVTSNNGGFSLTAPGTAARVYALDPATGRILWQAKPLSQKIFGPVSAVPGVAFVGTTAGTYFAFDTRNGAQLWSHRAPSMIGGGAAIVNGRIYWGYGFQFFSGGGDAGLLVFDLGR